MLLPRPSPRRGAARRRRRRCPVPCPLPPRGSANAGPAVSLSVSPPGRGRTSPPAPRDAGESHGKCPRPGRGGRGASGAVRGGSPTRRPQGKGRFPAGGSGEWRMRCCAGGGEPGPSRRPVPAAGAPSQGKRQAGREEGPAPRTAR